MRVTASRSFSTDFGGKRKNKRSLPFGETGGWVSMPAFRSETEILGWCKPRLDYIGSSQKIEFNWDGSALAQLGQYFDNLGQSLLQSSFLA